MSPVLQDKVAIVTGAGRGLGRAFALKYAEEGARLLLPDISLERAEATAGEIRANGGEAAAIETDISDEKATQEMADAVIRLYGKVDILLNNAALAEGTDVRPWDGFTVAEWDRMFAVNVRGTWLCCKAIAPLMIKQSGGKIINIASDLFKLPSGYTFLAYSCSKSAVYTMTQCLARALGTSGINVNAIGPGLTTTEASMSLPGFEQVVEETLAGRCLKRRQLPPDLAGTAVYLASEASDFVTGQIILVNGGAVMV